MKHTRGRVVDVDSVADFEDRLAAGAEDLAGWRCRSLDLRGRGDLLAAVAVAGVLALSTLRDTSYEPEADPGPATPVATPEDEATDAIEEENTNSTAISWLRCSASTQAARPASQK